LVKWRRCLLFLFRQSAVSPLTYPRLVRLLNPNFSEVGSNRRMLEEKAYRYLLKYMKEVAGKSWKLFSSRTFDSILFGLSLDLTLIRLRYLIFTCMYVKVIGKIILVAFSIYIFPSYLLM
jgi:hypothetical protein